MLFLFTGTPGASKTLNAIKFVNEDPLFAVLDDKGKPTDARRPVYYFNMREVQLPWTEMSTEQAMKWFNLPKGSVLIFDEAYDIFPQRLRGEAPEQVKKLATHRHLGMDIILITQKVTGQIDSFVRGLIGRHIHLERRFGTSMVTRLEWQKCCEDVNDYHAKKEALSKNITIDSKYFGAYHSAEVHTVKPNVPWKKVAIIPVLGVIAVSLIVFAFFHLKNRLGGGDEDLPKITDSEVQSAPFLEGNQAAISKQVQSLSKAEYLAQYVPRVNGLPHTAPVYDDVTRPKTYPKLSCMTWTDADGMNDCRCLTQQGTKAEVPIPTCRNLALNGYFDPAKEDRQQQQERRRREELYTRAAFEASAKYGGDPIADLKRLQESEQVTVIGNHRPYDHFFEGTPAKAIPSE